MTISFVVLFDLNSFPPGNDLKVQHKYLKWVQEHILTLASKAASNDSGSEVDYSKLMWTFKFFNSAKDVDYRNKEFEPFTISTFEAFEIASLSEYDRFRAQTATQDKSDLNRSSCLSQALMRITSDLRWEENSGKTSKLHNACYAILRVPRDEDELIQFTDSNEDFISNSPNSRHVLNALLPSAFFRAFHGKYNIQLNFIDTWVLHKHENLEKEWNGQDYSKQIVKVLDYLNHGTVIQLQKSQPAPPGLPSYFTLLKNSLKAATSTSPATCERLSEAQKLLKNTKGTAESSKLDSSFSSVQSVKPREMRRRVEHKENRGNSCSLKNKRSYPGLMFPDSGKVSPDSSTSEDMGSSIFENSQERALNRFILEVNSRKSSYHRLKSHKSGSRHLQQPSSAPQRKYRRSPPHSGRDCDRLLNGPNPFSRGYQLGTKATEKERKKWYTAINKEEEERRRLRDERQKVLSDFQCILVIMKTRLKIHLEKLDLKDSTDAVELIPVLKDFKEECLKDASICILSLSQTIIQFVVEKLQASKIFGQSAQEIVEKELFVPIPELRARVLKGKTDDKELSKVFRECQFQILIRFEASWLLPGSNESLEILKDEIVDLLSLLAIYMKKPVDDFMSNVVVQGYMETHSELLIRLYRGMNMDAPRNLILCVTPSKSIRSRCSLAPSSLRSPFGSTESLFVPPSEIKYKVNQKDPLKREDSFVSQKSSARYASHVYINNPKKTIMVPVRNVKKFTTGLKSPKPPGRSSRVRRNLFDSDGSMQKTSIPSLTGLVRSPKANSLKSLGSLLSSRVRSLRTKRKLNLDDDYDEDSGRRRYSNLASPDMFSPSRGDSDILCPATPSDKPYNSCKKMRRSSSHKSSSEKIIAESPELPKSGLSKSFSQAVHSLSFYSNGTNSFKSRAWEKSGNKMMAAKIKRTIDSSSFMNSGLTLSDLEIIGGGISSPESKSIDHDNFHSPKTRPKKKAPEESPCCSKTLTEAATEVEVVQANVNANIEALIRSDQSLALLKNTPKGSAATDTPTKKISFNFDESLVKTPKRDSPGTPKSILKTPNRGDVTLLRKSASNETDKETPVKPTHFVAASEPPTKIANPENASDLEAVDTGCGNHEAPPPEAQPWDISVPPAPAEVNPVIIPSTADLMMNTPVDPAFDEQSLLQDQGFPSYLPTIDDPLFPLPSIFLPEFPSSFTFQSYDDTDESTNRQTQLSCNFADSHHPVLTSLTEL